MKLQPRAPKFTRRGGPAVAHLVDAVALLLYPSGLVDVAAWQSAPFSLSVCYAHLEMDITKLPFNAFIGVERAQSEDALLQLPSDPRYLNHLGTVHASALLALAEASSGEFLIRHFGSSEGIVPVVRRLESKFRKPANGSVTSTASATPEALDRLTTELASKGRAIVLVAVELHDESGAHALSATVEWFIQRRPANDANA